MKVFLFVLIICILMECLIFRLIKNKSYYFKTLKERKDHINLKDISLVELISGLMSIISYYFSDPLENIPKFLVKKKTTIYYWSIDIINIVYLLSIILIPKLGIEESIIATYCFWRLMHISGNNLMMIHDIESKTKDFSKSLSRNISITTINLAEIIFIFYFLNYYYGCIKEFNYEGLFYTFESFLSIDSSKLIIECISQKTIIILSRLIYFIIIILFISNMFNLKRRKTK